MYSTNVRVELVYAGTESTNFEFTILGSHI